MTDPKLARDASGRVYVWPPDPPYRLEVPSTTRILKQIAKPFLTNWAAKEVATYAAENLSAWESLPTNDAIDLLKRSPYRDMSQKGDRGTLVHESLEALLLGEDRPEIPDDRPDIMGMVEAGEAFLSEMKPEITHIEATIYNESVGYAGTTDLLGLLGGVPCVMDWKTSKGIYPEHALQLVSYARGEFIGDPDTGDEIPIAPGYYKHGVLIKLRSNGEYEARPCRLNERLWIAFRACRALHDYSERTAPTVIRPAMKTDDMWRGFQEID